MGPPEAEQRRNLQKCLVRYELLLPHCCSQAMKLKGESRFLFYFFLNCVMIKKIIHPEAFMCITPSQIRLIQQSCSAMDLRCDEPLCQHTSFRVGGPAALMAFPRSPEELQQLLVCAAAHDVKPYILGAGTNVLAPDTGLRALVICTKDALTGLSLKDETTIEAYAGQTMAAAAVFAKNHALAGMEFAHGIPGTVGGGVYMNAGAYGGEMRQIVRAVTYFTLQGQAHTLDTKQCAFGYRRSVFAGLDSVIVRAELALQPGDTDAIASTMRELMDRRRASQPLELPSAGSTFKRPEGYFAGPLIEQAGLKGKGVGGARVSEKHAGFIVNAGGATAEDILKTIELVQTQVFAQFGVMLEPEVRIWREEHTCSL